MADPGLGAAMSMFGLARQIMSAGQQQASAASARSANKRIARKQYKHDKEVHKFNWRNTQRQYEHQKREVAINKRNNENQINWKNDTAEADWNHKLAIQDYEFEQKKKAYDKSFDTYNSTKDFNVRAANIATESIDNK